MTAENGVTTTANRTTLGRPRKDEYLLQVNIARRVRGTYVKGSSRTVQFLNAPWTEDEFATMVERMGQKAAGKSLARLKKATTRTVTL